MSVSFKVGLAGDSVKIKDINEVAYQDIFEMGISFNDLEAHENNDITFSISISKNGEEIERCPWKGYITVTVPTPEFEAMLWY